MRRFVHVLAAAAFVAGPAAAAPPAAARCPIAVDFASRCCGPDQASMRAIRSLLESRRFRSVRAEAYGWGLEGESTLCLHPGAAREKRLAELKRIAAAATPPANVPPPQIRLDEDLRGTFRGQLREPRMGARGWPELGSPP